MVNERIRERDLIEPVLKLIAEFGSDEEGLDVTRLDPLLRSRLKLSSGDMEMLKDRGDDRFSQVVRNLVSHRTLERAGLAEYRRRQGNRRGAYVLTPKGRARLLKPESPQQGDLFEQRR